MILILVFYLYVYKQTIKETIYVLYYLLAGVLDTNFMQNAINTDLRIGNFLSLTLYFDVYKYACDRATAVHCRISYTITVIVFIAIDEFASTAF